MNKLVNVLAIFTVLCVIGTVGFATYSVGVINTRKEAAELAEYQKQQQEFTEPEEPEPEPTPEPTQTQAPTHEPEPEPAPAPEPVPEPEPTPVYADTIKIFDESNGTVDPSLFEDIHDACDDYADRAGIIGDSFTILASDTSIHQVHVDITQSFYIDIANMRTHKDMNKLVEASARPTDYTYLDYTLRMDPSCMLDLTGNWSCVNDIVLQIHKWFDYLEGYNTVIISYDGDGEYTWQMEGDNSVGHIWFYDEYFVITAPGGDKMQHWSDRDSKVVYWE